MRRENGFLLKSGDYIEQYHGGGMLYVRHTVNMKPTEAIGEHPERINATKFYIVHRTSLRKWYLIDDRDDEVGVNLYGPYSDRAPCDALLRMLI